MQQAIGIFDSGLGGLSVFEAIRTHLPHEHLMYVADSLFAPYGNKLEACIIERSLAMGSFLQAQGVKVLVVACNTATAAAATLLRQHLTIPVIAMEPGIKPAVQQTRTGVVGILATENTLKSDKFSNLLDRHQHQARILTQPCHGLVEAVERGELNTQQTQKLLADYIQPMLQAGADTLVLGCTHYPWLEPLIRELTDDSLHIVHTGDAVARHVQEVLRERDMLCLDTEKATESFWTSGKPQQVSMLASRLLGRTINMQSMDVIK